MTKTVQNSSRRTLMLLMGLVLIPAYANDFFYISADTAEAWLTADYLSKSAMVLLVVLIPGFRPVVRETWVPPVGRAPENIALAVAAGLVILAAFHWAKPLVDGLAPGSKLFVFPEINQLWLYGFDLTFGLALTALCEEVVFRGLARKVLVEVGMGRVGLIVLPAMIFALAHWSNGIGSMAFAAFAGAVLMALYLRTGTLMVPVAVHYLVDLVLFL